MKFSILKIAKRTGYLAVLFLLTIILFGPAIPLDIAILLAGMILYHLGLIANPAIRASIAQSVRSEIKRLRAISFK